MPNFDYSRFNGIGDTDSEDEAEKKQAAADEKTAAARDVLADIPHDLPHHLSLVLAARTGQPHVVQALLDLNTDVNSCDPHGGTALLRAIESGSNNRDCIETLLKAGAEVDIASNEGHTPIGRAAAMGPPELLDMMLSQSKSPTDAAMGSALAAAAAANNHATTKTLLAKKVPVNAHGTDGRTALHAWAQSGDEEVMDALVKAKADVNACDGSGMTPLMFAAKAGAAAAVRWLCKRGAGADAFANDGKTPLVLAAENAPEASAEDTARALLEDGNASLSPTREKWMGKEASPLTAAAVTGRTALAKFLLTAKADAAAADPAGRRPLVCAAATSGVGLCKILLEHGANVNDRGTSGAKAEASGSGATALAVATAGGQSELVDMLIEAGADLTLLDERGRTPLMAAAQSGAVGICAVLLKSKADPATEQADSGKTALVFAAGAGHTEVCAVLMQAGADANAKTTTGTAAIHAAAANGHQATCERLLAGGAKASLEGPGGKNAAAVAKAAGHDDLAETLSKAC
eukprot:TRINITY_DN18288_c1_g1_i1.p1 TRINITY_DN18288_c1_g1~~TRINITY_DN18288_c1_g1_i1.p1  ORF type:complete len:520 (+),score=127.09 TRINITY_DN18288_c1_g1_i1:73-1632(+)